MASRKLSVEITGNARGGVDAMKSLSGAGDGMATKMHGVGQKVGNAFKYIGVAAVAGAAIVGKVLFDAVGAARESAKINAETARVIQSTGASAWGVSAKTVADYAGKLSQLTGVDDEVIQSGANLLLTFTNVQNKVGAGNDIFDQGVSLANDMSVALGQDMKSSSLQLGKALNDPIKGVTALSRAGVSFTQDQRDQIKTLQESGDVLGAQKIILGEVAKEFGGAAAAAATPMDRLKVTIGNLQERIGAALIPIIDRAATFLANNLPAALDTAGRFIGTLGDKIVSFRPAAESFISGLQSVALAVAPVVAAIARFIGSNPLPFVIGLGVAVGVLAVAMIGLAIAENAALLPFYLIAAALALVVGAFVLAYQKVDWFRSAVDAAIPVVVAIAQAIATNFVQSAQLLGSILSSVVGFFRTHWATISAIVSTAFGFIQSQVQSAMAVIRGIIQTVSSIIRGDWSGAWNGIVQIVSGALSSVRSTISFAMSAIRAVISAAWSAIQGGVSAAWGAIAGAVRSGINNVVIFVRTLPSQVAGALGNLASALYSKGSDLIQGFINGIRSKAASVASAVASAIPGGGAIKSLVGWAGATGGRPPVGIPGLIGENGPEIFVPDRPGTIIPNNAISGVSSGSSGSGTRGGGTYVTINAGTVVTEQKLTDLVVRGINEAQRRSSRPLLAGVS